MKGKVRKLFFFFFVSLKKVLKTKNKECGKIENGKLKNAMAWDMVRIGVLILIGFENYSQEKELELETETETGMVMTQGFWGYKQVSQPVTLSLSVYNRKPPNPLLLLCCQTLVFLFLSLLLFPFPSPPHHPNRYYNFDDDPTTCAIFQFLMEDSFI